MTKKGIPKELIDKFGTKRVKEFEKTVNIVFDKKQAMVRFPTVLGEQLNLKKGDKCHLKVDESGRSVKIVCELVRG